ncbi:MULTISPECIES: hypothetical protein [unclassified Oceanispirochaeta]|uniref:hypothetical protein n=1 Tax=unclassified Oceanispirochaeta TaxID=2635722 RepID=UPI000E08F760|nr:MULTISPECIES: hypothetical protein [unclassified Oceanispirochaeta]MBF9017922.1 hypothetical protein [Oceanispirochaeta sp. M2]NPD74433.1 hypothetical protein [Oceanispirochaeta sp. M1]RDG29733.1 hypothetical protein DV872_20225 [Oceanispirochaeta sp. M1]
MVNYNKFKEFMEQYFKDYSQYAQDAETMSRMDKYWTEDIKVTAYFQLPGGEYPFKMDNRRVWQDFLIKGHLTIWENLSPTDMMLDPVQLKTSSMLKVVKFDRTTNKELVNLDGIGYYTLIENEDGSLQIKSLDFFTGDAGTFASLYTQE